MCFLRLKKYSNIKYIRKRQNIFKIYFLRCHSDIFEIYFFYLVTVIPPKLIQSIIKTTIIYHNFFYRCSVVRVHYLPSESRDSHADFALQ